MESTIYFFTGTGNSLKVAKDLAENLRNCELIPIAKIWQKKALSSTAQKVGFIFPLYYSGLPKIVYDFMEKIDLTSAEYFFTIVTSAGGVNELPLQQVNTLLKAKSTPKSLHAGFLVTMPNNYIIGFDIHSEQRQKEFFKKERVLVKKISKIVKNKEGNLNREIFEKKLSRDERFNAKFREDVNESDRNFYVEDKCNSCRICENVCPVNNIIIIDGVPEWQHKCQMCTGCLHYCPEKAIQWGEYTLGRERYNHPYIKLKELINQKQVLSK